jgi:hypothetical protein
MGVDMQIKNLESCGYPLWFRFPVGSYELFPAVGLLAPKQHDKIINLSR